MKKTRRGLEDRTACRTRWELEEGRSDQFFGAFLSNPVPRVDHQVSGFVDDQHTANRFPLT